MKPDFALFYQLHESQCGTDAFAAGRKVKHDITGHPGSVRNDRFVPESLEIHYLVLPNHRNYCPGDYMISDGIPHGTVNELQPGLVHSH